MLDFSFAEILLIVVVAVVCIGPKDMPAAIRAVSRAIAQLKSFTREIKDAFDELSREAGLNEVKSAFERETKMIVGDDGKEYETFDISDLAPPGKPHEPR